MDDFLKIAITTPHFFPGEAERIISILQNREVDLVHIRKPESTAYDIKELLDEIPEELHPRLKLHDHFSLLDKYELGGIHLNSRNSQLYPGAKSVSGSIHNLDEIENTDMLDYFFISPVFDSISKQGYKAAFNLDLLSSRIRGRKAIALGGVTPEKFPMLKSLGFYGAALLGHFFPTASR